MSFDFFLENIFSSHPMRTFLFQEQFGKIIKGFKRTFCHKQVANAWRNISTWVYLQEVYYCDLICAIIFNSPIAIKFSNANLIVNLGDSTRFTSCPYFQIISQRIKIKMHPNYHVTVAKRPWQMGFG